MAAQLKWGASFWAFLHAFTLQWSTKMSGPFSVPFGLIAVFVPNLPAKVLSGILAILCVVYSSYVVWRAERMERLRLEDMMQPRLRIAFGRPTCEVCSNPDLVRLGVENCGGSTVEDAHVYVVVDGAKRELPWTGEGYQGKALNRSTIDGYGHFDLMARTQRGFELFVQGGLSVNDGATYRDLIVEGRDLPATRQRILITVGGQASPRVEPA